MNDLWYFLNGFGEAVVGPRSARWGDKAHGKLHWITHIVAVFRDQGPAENEANAQRFIASQAMLDALKAVAWVLETFGTDPRLLLNLHVEQLPKLKAAIARATERQEESAA